MRKRLMSNCTLRPMLPGKFDKLINTLTFAASVVQLGNAMTRPVLKKEYREGGMRIGKTVMSHSDSYNAIHRTEWQKELICKPVEHSVGMRPIAPPPLPISIIKSDKVKIVRDDKGVSLASEECNIYCPIGCEASGECPVHNNIITPNVEY
jgi:hypothetical protein